MTNINNIEHRSSDTRRENCGSCPSLSCHEIMGLKVYGCELTNLVVPQNASTDGVEFLRVPMECPLSDSEVVKRP